MSQSAFTCGHFDRIDRQTLEELFSKVAAVRAQNEELFEFTHRPITVYPSDEAGTSDPTTVTETEVLAEFSAASTQNQVTVIEGDTGTGKSELCAYLVHELRDIRPILRVDKDDDLMTILTKRLPAFYEEYFEEEMPSVAEFKRMERNIREVPRTVAKNATTRTLLRFDSMGIDLSYTETQEVGITDIVEDQLQQLLSQGEYGKDKNLITPELYNRKDCLDVFESSMSSAEALTAWNRELWGAIRDEYETPQLSEMLRRVGERFTNTRPVLVFEDFSIASVEARQLRNYMEDDPEDNWDFIVAGTRDVTAVLHTQTAEARFSFYQTNEPDSNSVLFLDEDSAVEFIRSYLGYIKHHLGDRSVTYNRTNGQLELQPPAPDSICDECGLCQPLFRDLYPFTETFLERIYAGLDESDRSPRAYVTKVFNILDEYYSGATDTPADSARLGSDVSNSETPADDVYDQAEKYADLAKWYGDRSNGVYVVPGEFVEAFGLEPETSGVTGIRIEDGQLLIPAAGSESKTGTGTGPGGGDGLTTERSLVERRYQEHEGNVDDWITDPAKPKFSQTNAYITAALTDLVNHVTDDYALWTDCGLRYNLSQNKDPYVLEHVVESPDDDQIILDQTEFRRSEVRSLLKYGIRLETDDAEPDTAQLLEELGTHIAVYGREWRQQVIGTYIESSRTLFSKKGRTHHTFDDFVLAAFAWLVMLDDPAQQITAATLDEAFSSGRQLTLDDTLASELQIHTSREEMERVTELFEYTDQITKLVGARFAITSNALGRHRVTEALATEPYEVLSSLAKTRIDSINSRIRFDPSSTLPDIATAAYHCSTAVEQAATDVDDQYRDIELFVLSNLEGVDMGEFGGTADRLSALSGVDREFNAAVQQLAQFDQADIDTAVDTAQFIAGQSSLSDQADIQAGLARMQLAGSRVFGSLSQLTESWTEPAEVGDGSYFLEVSERYVN